MMIIQSVVRVPGGEWKDLFEYNVQVDMIGYKMLRWYSLIGQSCGGNGKKE